MSAFMNFEQLLQDLKGLGEPTGAEFSRASIAVLSAVERRDRAFLNELLARVASSDDIDLQENFDTLMDLVCSEPDDDAPASEHAWRTFGLTVTTRCSGQVGVLRCKSYASTENALAEFLGLPGGDVKILPLLLPSTLAYDFGPLEAIQHCRATRRWAQGVQGFQLPWRPDTNKRIKGTQEAVESESVALVAIRLQEQDSIEVAAELQLFASDGLSRPAEGFDVEVTDETGESHCGQLFVVHAGTPWRTLGESLHSLETLQAGRMIRTQMAAHLLEASRIRCVAAYVENTDDTNSVRLACIGPGDELLDGVCFRDLHEPEVFIDKLDQLLGVMGCPAVHQLPQTYFSVEADQLQDEPRYLVPGVGWQSPPATTGP